MRWADAPVTVELKLAKSVNATAFIGTKLSDMLLHHYSDNEIKEIFSKEQSTELKHYTRPRGLWVSVVGDRDWPSLNPCDLRSQNQYEITLTDDAKVFLLTAESSFLHSPKSTGSSLAENGG